MAQKIKVITADSKEALETAVNTYIDAQSEIDPRVVVELAGGVTWATSDVWIATVLLSAPHKRSFEDDGRG